MADFDFAPIVESMDRAPREDGSGKERTMTTEKRFVERVVERVESRIEDWRERDRLRKAEAERHRDHLWSEAVERERLLAETLEQECPSGERKTGQRLIFVMHSEDAAGELEELAARHACISSVVPEKKSLDGVSGAKGSWLVFDEAR
jgi:hypothetical protein